MFGPAIYLLYTSISVNPSHPAWWKCCCGVRCCCSLVVDASECFMKNPAECLVATYCYFEAQIKGASITGGPKLVNSVTHLKNSTFGKSNRTHVLRRMKPKDIGHILMVLEMMSTTTMTNLMGRNLTTIAIEEIVYPVVGDTATESEDEYVM
ncbi:hypothetical protein Cgig2_024139 [Carnegiea gigantea]|uniref:Uncharacterized protein n=1 Tax=Carnegiea gigantea TaxID=171969 RepID=A0A9Q1GRJ5_9CARY|nr:hypothetical protein Cgig2_024139 [Carnegiea gigantea]